MAKYDSWSLREIKAAMRDAHTKMHQMSTMYETYAEAANTLDELVGRLTVARSGVQVGWQGPASDASSAALDGVVRQSDGSRDASAHLARLNRKLARSTAHHHDLVDGVPDVDTSWVASMDSSYMNPFMALPDHDARVYHATRNQQLAASHARALDHVSGEWEHDMKATDWPSTSHQQAPLPPRTLPARQQQPPPTHKPPVVVPPPTTTAHPDPTPQHPVQEPPDGDRTTGNGDGVDPTSVLTAGAHGGGGAGATGSGTGGVGGLGSGGGSGSGLGGLGGGGGLGGLGGLGGSGGGSGGRGAAGRTGDERGAGSRVGVGEPEAGERGAARGLGAGAANERGAGMMGAPMGGAGRRGSGDEEHRRPDYLEDDDVWGANAEGVPPVLGED